MGFWSRFHGLRSHDGARVLLLVILALTVALPALGVAQTATLRPGGTPTSGGLLVLAGSLHDHSTDSDGDISSEAVAAFEFAHRDALGIDFGSLTDHADFFPFSYRDPLGGNVWAKQARLTARYSRDGFSFLRGFEYTADQENHVGIIGSSDYLGRISHYDISMNTLYRWIAMRDADARAAADGRHDPGIAQFNHPSEKGALQWDNLVYDPAVGNQVATIEVTGDQAFTPEGLAHSDAGWYWLALTRGWTVGPAMNWDTHRWREKIGQSDIGVTCGVLPRTLPCQRTLVLAESPTPQAIMAALRARRITATEHPSLWATLRAGEIWQGSTVPDTHADMQLALTLEAGSSQWPLTRVDIVSDNGIDPHPFYDGDNLTCPAASGAACEREAKHDGPVATSYLLQHRFYVESGGYALRKGQIDGPPLRAIVATLPITGRRALETILVRVPRLPSMRPDRKHFFYAIVWAGNVRAWTAPVFTDDTLLYADRRGAAARTRTLAKGASL